MNRDLKAAGIPKKDADGCVVHVHALRHSFGTHLSLAGVSPRVAQAAMRHSNISLTMGTYTDARLLDTSEAIETLPIFRNLAALRTLALTLAPTLAPNRGQTCQNESISVNSAMDDMDDQNTKKPSKSLENTGFLLIGDIGSEIPPLSQANGGESSKVVPFVVPFGQISEPSEADKDLEKLVAIWHKLNAETRGKILAVAENTMSS